MTTNEEASPYEPPKTSRLEIEEKFLELQKASRGRRCANYLLDLVGYMLVIMVTTYVSLVFAPEIVDTETFDLIIGLPVYLAYYILFEGLTGRTPGKLITGTRVVDAQGNKPGFGTLVLRNLARFIPFEAFSFFRTSEEGWHDTLTKTHVIRKHPPKESA